MAEPILLRSTACLACALVLAHCQPAAPPAACIDANGCGVQRSDGSGGTLAGTPTGAVAGSSSAGVTATAGTLSSASTPGASGGAGSTANAGGATAPAATAATAGNTGNAGVGAGGGPAAGTGGGAPATGGMSGASSSADQGGEPLAKPGDSKTDSRQYLNLGDFRLLVNKWGSDELSCNTTMKVFTNADKTFGWSFERGACGGNKQKPDYPELEFGIHPFGSASNLATTPSFPSTTVLPLQIKDVQTASVALDGLNASIQGSTWNVNVELWLSQKNPVIEATPSVYAELIAFWAWQDGWGCDQSGSITSGDKTYDLCHQNDNWGSGWRYYQFRASNPSSSYTGKVDVKALLDWLVSTRGFSTDLWLTRLEVGSELDDNTVGMVTLRNITFEVNGTSSSARFAP